MKKLVCLSVFFACIFSSVNAQWQPLSGYSATESASSLVVLGDTMIASSTGNAYDMTPGFLISSDHGNTWSAKNNSLGIGAYPLIADGEYLYAGTNGQGVNLSTDKSVSWTTRNNGLPSNFQVLDLLVNNSDFYVCGSSGIFHSADSAKTWENISLPGTVQAVSVIVVGDTIISSFVFNTSEGVYKSTNNGVSWSLIDSTTGLSDTRIRKFTVFHHTLFAASNGDLGTGNVYVSTDNGISWTAANGLFDVGHNVPFNFITSSNTIFLATTNGVHQSNDYGLNWISTGCSNTLSLAIVGDTLFTGTGWHGIWKRGLSELIGGVEEITDNRKMTIYPNPASDMINIELKQVSTSENALVSIHDIRGHLLLQEPVHKEKTEINILGLEKGIYMVKLTSSVRTEVIKFVKE
jgi:photosystem II stability/assembly factor-like uncharacterized protein